MRMTDLLEPMDRAAQRAGAFGRIRFITPVSYAESTGTVRDIYDQILAEYGLGGPYFVTSVSPPLLATTWNLVRTSMLSGPLGRGKGEALAAAVAKAESCPFCVDVHTELAGAAGERDTASLVARGDWESMRQRGSESDHLALWARDAVGGSAATPPIEAGLAPYAISIALTFVHITTLVTIFQEEGLVAGFGRFRAVDGIAKAYMRKSLGKRMLKRGSSPALTPGLPSDAGSSEDYGFTQSVVPLAAAWAAWDQAVGATGADLLSQQARLVVDKTIAERQGCAPSLDLHFVDEALDSLPENEQGNARLALLAGTAPYRIARENLNRSGPEGDRGGPWVALAAYGARARVRSLARSMAESRT